MSRSTTVRTTAKGSGTRGRGQGRGRGRQTRHNFTFSPPTIPGEDVDEDYTYSERRRGSFKFPQNQGNNQPFNGRRSNFRANENGNEKSHRIDNTASNSSCTTSNSSRIPEHAQNPIFIGQLMSRFNNMLPSSMFLDDEKDSTQEPEVLSNPNPFSDIPELDSIRNRSVSGSSFNFKSKENNSFCDHNENMKRNPDHKENRSNTRNNGNPGNNNLSRVIEGLSQTNFRQREPNSPASSFNRRRKPENVRNNDNFNRPNSSAIYNHSNNSGLELSSNLYNRKIPSSSNKSNNGPNKSNNGPTTLKNVSLEKRKEIMKQFGFNIEPSNKNSSNISKSTADNTELHIPQSLPHGLIASRTSPRIRYNLENGRKQNLLSSNVSDQIENDNSEMKSENQYPQNSSVLGTFLPEVERCDKKLQFGYISSDKAKPNIQNVKLSDCSSGKSSEENLTNNEIKGENLTRRPGLGDEFFAHLDAFSNSSNNLGNKQSLRPPPNNVSAGKNSQNFNPFLISDQTITPQDRTERSNSPNQRNMSMDRIPGLFLPPNTPRLIDRNVAGRNPLNVHRPARDANERVPSRAEALEALQEQYEIQSAIHEQKKKEKEAKKREEYLARYKHVDQGYRLSEGLLDEAAGYAPGFNPFETVEDVRQRQQEQLRHDALVYQERMREEEEKQKRKEENNVRERLQKNKHYDAGYRLGSGDKKSVHPAEVIRANRNSRKKGYKNVQQNNNFHRSGEPDERNSFSPELLLEGETEEEAIQRQQEQLEIEMLIQNQMELQRLNSQAFVEENHLEEYKGDQAQRSATSEGISQCVTIKAVGQTLPTPLPIDTVRQTPIQGPSSHGTPRQLDQPGGSSSMIPKYSPAENLENAENVTKKVKSVQKPVAIEESKLITQDHLATKRQSNNPQLDQLSSKVSRSSESQAQPGPAHVQVTSAPAQGPAPAQVTTAPVPNYKQPASCVLKNRNGAVLVLRPTAEELNQTLARKVEVQDDFDKKGYSILYKPQIEQEPKCSNNRYEKKPDFDTVKSTGAIPKKSSISAAKPSPVAPLVPTNNSVANNENPKQVEPPIDHKAEMAAARLKLQQRYEESLKKQQEEQRSEP